MKEVSGKAAEFLIEALEQRGIRPERLVEGLPVRIEELREGRRRLDWDLHVRLMTRLGDLLGPRALEQVGAESLHRTTLERARALAGYMVRPQELYWMAARWVGPTYFSHLHYRYEELDAEHVRFVIEIPESHTPCEAYFRINCGALRSIPRLLGMEEEAEVEMELSPDGRRAEFLVRPPRRRSLWSALRRLLGTSQVASEAASQAVEELARQQYDLNRGIEELHAAERTVDDQRGQLRTLETLGQTLVSEIESQRLGEQLLEALRERFGWSGAALWAAQPGGADPRLICASGAVTGGPTSHALQRGGRPVGRLDVWGAAEGPESAAATAILRRLLPWIAMAVDQAHGGAGAASDDGVGFFRWSGAGSAELFLIVDADGLVRYAGPGASQVLGVSQDDLLSSDILDLVHPDDWPGLTETFTSFGDAPGSATFSGARVRHADGSWRVLEGVGIKVQDERDRPVYMFSASDVTYRRRAH